MKVYVLREQTEVRPHGSSDDLIAASTSRNLIFERASRSSQKELGNKSSWEDRTYWIDIFDSKTGKKLDELEFVNDREEKTFGKIVRERGSRDEKIVSFWHK